MDVQVIIDNLPLYFQGLWVTILLVVSSLILGLCLALPLALLATSKNRWVRIFPQAYIYFFPGNPVDRANVYDLPRHGAV